jgi:chemotaxis family two-component system response regulator Rcp1
MQKMQKIVEKHQTILLVEDNKADIYLIKEAFKTSLLLHQIITVRDGIAALAYLSQSGEYLQAPLPDLILLDLNLPKKDGKEVLAEIKSHPKLKNIPIIVLTTAKNEQDILQNYDLETTHYITKSRNLDQLFQIVKMIEDFCLSIPSLSPENKVEQ